MVWVFIGLRRGTHCRKILEVRTCVGESGVDVPTSVKIIGYINTHFGC